MPFTPQHVPTPYTFKRLGPIEGSERIFIEREVRELGKIINKLVDAVKEMQEKLNTL